MSNPPSMIEVNDFPGADYGSQWKVYLECIYQVYLKTVAFGGLTFKNVRVNCQFRPETNGKHFAFWHMIQEGSGGRTENDRTPDLERCRRVEWISWVIKNTESDAGVRVFTQSLRWGETSWVLWLHEYDYAVILWERADYFLLKTAFMVKPHKAKEFERDWNSFQRGNG